MRTPVRPYVTVGIALASAAVLVANPIVPAPADIRVPADGQPVELTAITNPPVLGAILLQIQRNQINDAIEIRNGLTTGAILILNPLLATPGVLAVALAEDVQNASSRRSRLRSSVRPAPSDWESPVQSMSRFRPSSRPP